MTVVSARQTFRLLPKTTSMAFSHKCTLSQLFANKSIGNKWGRNAMLQAWLQPEPKSLRKKKLGASHG